MSDSADYDAKTIAALVRSGELSALDVAGTCLKRIAERDSYLNCFTTVTRGRALAAAERVDKAIAESIDPGPLAGVPYAVKNLFDIAGYPTLAGSKINRASAPASS